MPEAHPRDASGNPDQSATRSGPPQERTEPRVDRPDPEDRPVGPLKDLEDFDPADNPSNPDLVGRRQDEPDPEA